MNNHKMHILIKSIVVVLIGFLITDGLRVVLFEWVYGFHFRINPFSACLVVSPVLITVVVLGYCSENFKTLMLNYIGGVIAVWLGLFLDSIWVHRGASIFEIEVAVLPLVFLLIAIGIGRFLKFTVSKIK